MLIRFTCTYCGHKWDDKIFIQSHIESQVCPKCGDENLKVKDANKDKIDAYKDCPPFPDEDDYGTVSGYALENNIIDRDDN